MKVKELINILQACDPEIEVQFRVGDSKFYRKALADLIANARYWRVNCEDGTEVLEYMIATKVVSDFKLSECIVELEQNYLADEVVRSAISSVKNDEK